jgi:predicted DNA binding protein
MVLECLLQIAAENYYSCELTDKIPVRVSIMTINGDTGFGVIEPVKGVESHLKEYVDKLKDDQDISEVEVTYKSPKAYWTRVVHHLEGPSIYETILSSGCMSQLPIIIQDGVQKHTVLAPSRDTVKEMLSLLRKRFSEVQLLRLRTTPYTKSGVPLTDKQMDAFRLAHESGYYEIPRSVKIAELAKKLDISRVAMQERLRRAERNIMNAYAHDSL